MPSCWKLKKVLVDTTLLIRIRLLNLIHIAITVYFNADLNDRAVSK